MHLFLSPHADDAALSCGGQIAQLTRKGETVIIFTLMAGDPPVDFHPTELTDTLHGRWNAADGFVATAARRKEDTTAARMLGAVVKFGPYADAIYRRNPHNSSPLYYSEDTIFGEGQPADPVHEGRRAA